MDLSRRSETAGSHMEILARAGLDLAISGSRDGVEAWVEGFRLLPADSTRSSSRPGAGWRRPSVRDQTMQHDRGVLFGQGPEIGKFGVCRGEDVPEQDAGEHGAEDGEGKEARIA